MGVHAVALAKAWLRDFLRCGAYATDARFRETFLLLYTDLANSTSNSIYQKIGYQPVCDVQDWIFE